MGITHNMTARGAFREVAKAEREIWVTYFTSQLMDGMNLEAISNADEVRAAFPKCISDTNGFAVACWKYSEHAGLRICNEKATMLKAHKFQHRTCNCAHVDSKFKDASGHVCTTNLEIVSDEYTRNLMKKGTTFRDLYQIFEVDDKDGKDDRPHEIIMLDSSLDNYIDISSDLNEVPKYWFYEWKGLLLQKAEARLEEMLQEQRDRHQDAPEEEEARELSKEFLASFRTEHSIVTADKASNTYVVVCKPWLHQQAIQEAHNTPSYFCSDKQGTGILEADKQFSLGEQMVVGEEPEPIQSPSCDPPPKPPPKHAIFQRKLPTFGVVIKLHKANKPRFLAKSHETSLVQLSQWISLALKTMMRSSEELWRSLFLSVGIVTHSSWIVNNSKQIRSRMKHMTSLGLSSDTQQTYDFATMYPSLDLDCMKKKLSEYTSLVFEHARQNIRPFNEPKVLVLKRKCANQNPWKVEGSTAASDTPSQQVVTADRLEKWLRHLANNLHVRIGEDIMRQTKGLPMGTSCSPWLANIMLFMYEFDYFSERVSNLQPWEIRTQSTAWQQLRDLSICTRYIDDLWNPLVDRAAFEAITKLIYPAQSGLSLGDPESDGPSVDYLDLTVWCDAKSHQWHSKLYDKKVAMVAKGLKLNKFPDPASKLSTRCKYGVITSQLHRYNVACTRRCDFLVPAQQLYSTYIQKGYHRQKVHQYFGRFLRRHVPHYQPARILRQLRWGYQP